MQTLHHIQACVSATRFSTSIASKTKPSHRVEQANEDRGKCYPLSHQGSSRTAKGISDQSLHASPTVNGHRGGLWRFATCDMPYSAESEIDRLTIREMT